MFSFFKRPKPNGFGFQPRFYDQAKEEREMRLAKYKKQGDEDGVTDIKVTKDRIRSGFRSKGRSSYISTKDQDRQSSFRLLIIIAILAMLAYILLRSDKILNFVKLFSGE
ncbi:MAG TPA: hypothetical protein PLY70_02265 [Saprospiraceae bacterium]|nr:hypothetical protein [Saprospiraceae bacterium]HPN71179.1 hypothetical protein [Saprospiraceae bacterium]